MHNEAPHVATIRKLYAEDPDTSHYKTSGQAATIENGWPIPVITAVDKSPETAAEIAAWPKLRDREGVQKYLEWNARETGNDYVKVMNESGTPIGLQLDQPSSELLRIIVDESKQRGFLVVAHSMCVKDTLQVLEAGVDGLTHTICDRPPTDELVAAYKKNNAWCNPTLATIGSLTAEGRELQEKFAHDERVKGLLGEGQSEKMCSCFEMGRGHSKVEYAYESVRRFKQAGVDVIAGSDAAGPLPGIAYGISLHHELTLYVDKCGFTPREAIESATIVPARRFRWDDRGRLAPGLRADLVLVEGDPLEDIDKLLNLRGVWRDGVLCSVYKDVLGEGVGVN
ncbi:aryldialkylphosphatase [Westerdykella ornata]|uniref:Aryldialkylphosphatase n=1 Tax=Westerdykella ornata TaxID=318751 RepID=A0A6A6JAU2_WESOR|nr:aryldialkylphosphatase [Westerdykella ornata]KAF2273098.1 aryldialkylphosphatase [Westerdykella ornata]